MNQQKNQAFTLVELIVVITIISILGTIAFISLQGYSSNARNSVRITDLANIKKVLETGFIKTGSYPLPDDYVEITASGTIISYQGYFGDIAVRQTDINNIPLDPKNNERYTYTINANKTKYSILTLLEGNSELDYNQILYNYSVNYSKIEDKRIGIIIQKGTQTPINKILTGNFDLLTSTEISDYDYYFDKDEILTSTGEIIGYGQSKYCGVGNFLTLGICTQYKSFYIGSTLEDNSRKIINNKEGGFVIGAGTTSFGNGRQGTVELYDMNFNKQNSKIIGGVELDYVTYGIQTQDGGYMFLGETNKETQGSRDLYVYKTDKNLNKIFSKIYGTSAYDVSTNLYETSDSSVIIVGATDYVSPNFNSNVIIKIDKDGNKEKSIKFSGDMNQGISEVLEIEDGYLFVGNTNSYGNGDKDGVIIKTDKNLNKIFIKTIGGGLYDTIKKIIKINNGFVLVGSSNGNGGTGGFDGWILKVDNNFNIISNITIGGLYNDSFADIITNDTGYILVGDNYKSGNIDGDSLVVGLDMDFNIKWSKSYGGILLDYSNRITELKFEQGYLINGLTWSYGKGGRDLMFTYIPKNYTDKNNLGFQVNNYVNMDFIDQTDINLTERSCIESTSNLSETSPSNLEKGIIE